MRYVVSQSQINVYQRENYLELEGVLTPEQTKTLHTFYSALTDGYEQQRLDSALKSALHLKRFAQLASALFERKRLRLAYSEYAPPYRTPHALEEISSLTDIAGGVLIALDEHHLGKEPYLPKAPGNATFIAPTYPIDFPGIESPLLLLVFAGEKARYKQQEADLHAHFFKKLGYSNGDRITSETHPFLADRHNF